METSTPAKPTTSTISKPIQSTSSLITIPSNELNIYNLIKFDGYALELASDELKNNFYVVYTALKTDGILIKFASNELKNDFDIGYMAVKNNGLALEFLSIELRKNYDICLAALVNTINSIEFILLDIEIFYDVIITMYPYYIKNIKDPSISLIKMAVEQDGMLLKYVMTIEVFKSLSINEMTNIKIIAIKNNPQAIQFAEIDNINIWVDCINKDLSISKYAPSILKEQIILKYLKKFDGIIEKISSHEKLYSQKSINSNLV